MHRVGVSVVIPCLNEEEAVGAVVDDAWAGIRATGLDGEVIVVDNASTDRSAEVAAAHGATVITESRRGYGSAYLAGLAHARGDYIVMGDADETYDLTKLKSFVDMLADDHDFVLGSRFDGAIDADAMPWHHRWIGNPILTAMLNAFFPVRVSDAHCGMRAVRRTVLPVLDLHAPGMEFASEMVFKAARRNLRIGELPIHYRARVGDSKLHSFRDAWRHVRFMLLYSPSQLYFVPGGILFLLGLVGLTTLAGGPVSFLGRSWYLHAMIVASMFCLIGSQTILIGLVARTYAALHLGEQDPLVEGLRSHFRLEHGILASLVIVVGGAGALGAVGLKWATSGFGALSESYLTLFGATLVGLGLQTFFGSFLLSMFGMGEERRREALRSQLEPSGADGDALRLHSQVT